VVAIAAQQNGATGHRQRRVDYTLGGRRIQHYVTGLAGGRVILSRQPDRLPP
jgi:hypothetical protein